MPQKIAELFLKYTYNLLIIKYLKPIYILSRFEHA